MFDLIAKSKEDIEAMHKQIKSLESGRLQSNDGTGWVDVTQFWIDEYKKRIINTEALITYMQGK